MSPIELRILKPLSVCKDMTQFQASKNAFHNLKTAGYISCIFDEQGELITAPQITSLGKKVILYCYLT